MPDRVAEGSGMASGASTYQRIYDVVRRIPKGRVATYGQVARLAGMPGHARQVGYALNALNEDSGVPWHRVVNARGEVSQRSEAGYEVVQREMLEAEGILFDGRGRLSLSRHQWKGRMEAPRRRLGARTP